MCLRIVIMFYSNWRLNQFTSLLSFSKKKFIIPMTVLNNLSARRNLDSQAVHLILSKMSNVLFASFPIQSPSSILLILHPTSFVSLENAFRLIRVNAESVEESVVHLSDVLRAVFPTVESQSAMFSFFPVAFKQKNT